MKKLTKEEYKANGEIFNADELLPCPCCGGIAKITFIGNSFTKSRKCEIKCTKCFLKRVSATIRFSQEWNANNNIAAWNLRTALSGVGEEEKTSWTCPTHYPNGCFCKEGSQMPEYIKEGKLCMEKNCKRPAAIDYNGHKHFVCKEHYESLSRYFDEEYK